MGNKPKKYALSYLLESYKKEKLFSFFYFILPLLITLITIILKNIFLIDLDISITDIISCIISIFPTLIGFVVAGYAILTTFSNDKYLSKIVEFEIVQEDRYYLQISSIFGWSVIVQISGIMIAFVCKTLYPLNYLICNIETRYYIFFVRTFIRSSIELLLLFIMIYSFFQLFAIVLNLFMWTKSFHDYLVSEYSNSE